jgi:PAS domain S-box-containing protein
MNFEHFYTVAHAVFHRYELFWLSGVCGSALIITAFLLLLNSREKQEQRQLHLRNSQLNKALQKKTAELAQAEREEALFRTAVELLPDAVIVTAPDGRILHSNKAAHKDTGYADQELLGRPVSILWSRDSRHTREEISREESGLVLKKHESWNGEIEVQRKDASGYPASVSSALIHDRVHDRAGASPGRVWSIKDLTAVMTAGEHAEAVSGKLESKLRKARRMEAVGLMAGGVAHDLNNMLTGILHQPERLLRNLPRDSPLRHSVEKIHNSGLEAAALVADLLTAAKGVTAVKETADLNTLVRDVLESPDLQTLLLAKPGISIRRHLAQKSVSVSCSPSHIRQCLLNLLINGCDAVEKTGKVGTISISTDSRYVDTVDTPSRDAPACPKGGYAVLSVTDTGSRISSVDLEHIFEPFYSKKVMGRSGTGIGLAVVRNIMEDHDGCVDIHTGGRGTGFDLYFPVATEQDVEQIEIGGKDEQEPTGDGQRILVIDDEKSQRDRAVDLLTKLGYQPMSVADGEGAVAYLNSHKVDLLLLDMMPEREMNGGKTYEQVLFLHPSQKAVITCALPESDAVKKMREPGAEKILPKPYTLNQLSEAVRQALVA